MDKISYGSKVSYQHHPAWFAEHGYVCLILDTLQLAEIQGVHHGTSRRGMWWWQTLGYTPAGIECWNAMRALDYLQSRKEVDPKRLGVTGRSGGGATSWWIAAADDRVAVHHPRRRHRRPAGARRRRGGAASQDGRHHRPLRLHVLRQHLSLGFRRGAGPVRPAAAAARQQRRGRHLPRARLSPPGRQGEAHLRPLRRRRPLRAAGDEGAAQGHAGAARRRFQLDEPLAEERHRRDQRSGTAAIPRRRS